METAELELLPGWRKLGNFLVWILDGQDEWWIEHNRFTLLYSVVEAKTRKVVLTTESLLSAMAWVELEITNHVSL